MIGLVDRDLFVKSTDTKLYYPNLEIMKLYNYQHFSSFTTTALRAKRAKAFGITMRLLNISAISHTKSLERQEPRNTNTTAMQENTLAALAPKR